MELLLDKVAWALTPNNFAKILPYCFWYWIVFTLIFYWIIRKK